MFSTAEADIDEQSLIFTLMYGKKQNQERQDQIRLSGKCFQAENCSCE